MSTDFDYINTFLDKHPKGTPLEIPLTTVNGKRLVDMTVREIEDLAADLVEKGNPTGLPIKKVEVQS